MRTVLRNNQEVIETFNKQSQYEGRCNSLFFEGDTLYSYGYHYPLAKVIKHDTILINDLGYSMTTSKHIGLTYAKTSDKKQINVSEISIPHVLSQMQDLNYRLLKARKPSKYKEQIKALWDSFNDNVSNLLGFYVVTINNGYFSRSSNVKFVSAVDEMPPLYVDQLKAITKIYKDSLNF